MKRGGKYNALYEINSLGLRDREYGPKTENVFRVLLLGDSFSVSHGLSIEDSLSRQLERALQKFADSDGLHVKFEVVNAAAGGYSPYNYWKAYIRWAPIFDPDAVVVALSPDDYDSSNADLIYIFENGDRVGSFKQGQAVKKRGGSTLRRARKWLSWNSEFYILLRNYFYYNEFIDRIKSLLSTKEEIPTNQLQQFMVPQPGIITKQWAQSFTYLEYLHKAVVEDEIPMVVLSLALKEEIDPTKLQSTLLASGINPNDIDINQPLNQIKEFCNHRNIPLFDPRPAIKKRHKEIPCYFVYDGHWIPEGIRVATILFAKQWREIQLSPWNNRNSKKIINN